MSNIIRFMEELGSTASLKHMAETELVTMLREQGVNVDTKRSIVSAVEFAIDARNNVVCGVFPAEEPGKEQPNDDEDDDKKDTESLLVVNG